MIDVMMMCLCRCSVHCGEREESSGEGDLDSTHNLNPQSKQRFLLVIKVLKRVARIAHIIIMILILRRTVETVVILTIFYSRGADLQLG